MYPQIQSPGMPAMQAPIQQSVVPSADALYNAMFQASQPQLYATQSPDYFGSTMGLLGSLGGGWLAGR